MLDKTNAKTNKWLTKIKKSGYRLTGPRYFVVEILTQADKALTAQDIYYLAQPAYPSLGLVSVYRTLEKLELLGLIQRVHRRDNCHAFIAAPGGHEHLLVCRECGRVSFFQGDDLKTLVVGVEQESGYRVLEHWLQLIGICESCQNENVGESQR
jgi:Fur family transcriptional regulator, ferric uptake regulator